VVATISANVNWLSVAVKQAWAANQETLSGIVRDALSRKTPGISPRIRLLTISTALRMGVVTVAATCVSVLFLLMLLMAVVLEIAKPKVSVKPSEVHNDQNREDT
jgi:hypothetical protein